jgi:hypothetical protein
MRVCLLAGIALIAGCSNPETKQPAEDLRTFDVQSAPAPEEARMSVPPPPPPVSEAAADGAGPNINVTAAPGVAFNYRYAFRLANARIQAAQEAHAAMCEKLTITRCRITGMRYSLVNERDISASLELKLDPKVARQFGKDATRVVAEAEGMLVDQQISGIDVAPSIDQANRGRAELQDELERVNRELARPGISNVIRDRLLGEAQALRAQIAALGEQKKAAEESLATTPMAFHYGSGRTVPGFDERRPLRDAVERAGYNFQAAVGFLILAFATLLPWALLIAFGYWLLRRLGLFRWSNGATYTRQPDDERELHAPPA